MIAKLFGTATSSATATLLPAAARTGSAKRGATCR
jgi:hypothetical protein